jgi:hypothetical protein
MSDMIFHVEAGDADEARDLEIAKAVSEALATAYANHYWLVSFQGHNLVLRHVLIANAMTMATGREGFSSLLPREKIGTVHEACKTAVKFGGALLEAFGLDRGAWDGEQVPVIPADLRAAVSAGRMMPGWGRA